VKSWELIADNLSKAGCSWGCVSAIDSNGRTIWIADAHGSDGKRFVARGDEKLSVFVEVECAAIQECSKHLIFSTIGQELRLAVLALSLFLPGLSWQRERRANRQRVGRDAA
jgi:hypothetical protein